jgi:hypothetical protein
MTSRQGRGITLTFFYSVDWYYFDEEQDSDPDPYQSEKPDPNPHQIEKRDPD